MICMTGEAAALAPEHLAAAASWLQWHGRTADIPADALLASSSLPVSLDAFN
jgi:hypothetical protein